MSQTTFNNLTITSQPIGLAEHQLRSILDQLSEQGIE